EAMNIQLGDRAALKKRQLSRFFGARLLELGAGDALHAIRVLTALFGVPEYDLVGTLQTQQVDELGGKTRAANPSQPRGLHIAITRGGSEHGAHNLVGGHAVDGTYLLARQRGLSSGEVA